MEKTIVLRRDYTYIYNEDREDNRAANDFWDAVCESSKLREAFELHRSVPRMINPSHQNVFTYMVKEADAFARDFGGTIEASIDYDRYKAEIKLLLPFFDMTQKREKFFFMKAMALTDSIDVTPAADNENINMTLNFKYFTELTASKEDLERADKQQRFMQELAETLGDYDDEDN